MTVQAMKAGAVEFLTKPVRDQDLLDAIQQAIDRDRVARAERAVGGGGTPRALQVAHAARTGSDAACCQRDAQQANRGGIGHERGYSQAAAWPGDAQNAGRIVGGSGQDGGETGGFLNGLAT